VTVTDDKLGVVACQDTTMVGDKDAYLDPGESVVCPTIGTVAYTVTAGDVSTGSVTNTAHGSADGVDSPNTSVIVPLAALTIDKDTSTPTIFSNGNVTYTIVVVNTGQIALTNIQVTDNLPFTAGQYTVTGVNASVTSGAINPNGSYNGSSNTNLLAGTDTFAIGATATITVNLTLNNATLGTYDNTATAITTQTGSVDDDGLVGGDPDTPGIGVDPETDEDVVVFAASPTKSIVTTSEPSTGNVSGTERVTIGEMVRYRIASLIPEGSFTTVQLTDIIPNGLQFLDDGTATVAFVCNGGAGCMTSSTLAGVGLVVNGSSNNISPAFAVPGSAISGGTFVSGTDVTFSLGNITNTDSDADSEYVVIEFNALVLNVNTSAFINQGIDNSPGSLGGSNGNFRINTAALSVNGLQIGSTSPNVTVSIAEPAITSITKSVSPATGPYLPGDVLTYTMSFTNVANGGSASTAFDVVLSDTFDANLALGTVNVISTQGTSGVSACAGGTSFTAGSSTVGQLVTATVSCLDPGNSVTVTVNATIASSTSSGITIANSSSLTYTSLPGVRGNCSTAPFTCIGIGIDGSGTGERNGSNGSGADNTVLNNYAVTSNPVNTPVTYGSITITKDAIPNDPQDFTFTGAGPAGYDFGGGFSLDDDTDGTLPNTHSFNNLVPGSYSVTEGGLLFLNWSLTGLTCTDPDGGSTTDLVFATATIDLDAGESIICTFTNTVLAPVIDAGNDSGATVNGMTGGQALANVLVNDTLNGAPTTLVNVTLTQVSTTNPNVTLNPADGSVNVAPGTPAGTYTVTYEICDLANTPICDAATVTVPVVAPVIDAVNDSVGGVNGLTGATNVLNVFTNDTLNGVAVNPADVTLTLQPGGNTELTLNNDGSVDVAPGTPAGTYTFDYEICEVLNPTDCDIATVTVTVVAPVIDAVDDSGVPVNGTTGGTSLANVLVNDTLNGNPATLANVTLTQVSTTNPNVTLNPADGSVNVVPGTPAGNYTVTYEICDQVNPAICDTATVTVQVAQQQANLQLTKAVSNTTPLVATNIDFTLTVTNVGPDPATNVQVTDQLPGGFTFVSDSTAPSGTTQGTYSNVTGLWDIGDLAVNQTETLRITVTVNISGPYTNYAEITTSDQVDPNSNPGNGPQIPDEDDDDSVTVTPAQNSPNLGKSVSGTNQVFTTGSNVAIGEVVTYTVTIYVPPGIFTNAQLMDTMERGLSFMTCANITGSDPALTTDVAGSFTTICSNPTVDDAGGGITVDVGRRVTFDLGTLTNASGADQTLTFEYSAVVLDSAANVSGASLDNSAEFSSDSGAVPPSTATVTIVEPDLSISKTASTSLVSVGSEITITLTIQHTAGSETNAYDVVVSDPLPAELDYVPGTLECVSGAQDADTCTYNSVTRTISATWNNFALVGGNGKARFRVRVVSVPATGVSNTANVAWTSLPGDVSAPQNSNVFSKERSYDPASQIDVYGADDTLLFNVFGSNNNNTSSNKTLLPATGFAPNVVTDLNGVQKDAYTQTGGLMVEIPSLGIKIPVVGVPLKNGEWDVSWLANQAGWLEGSAFPSWSGNSVLTGHVYGSDGLPGPFVKLNSLKYGDKILVHAYGRVYAYEVRTNTVVEPNDTSVFKHEEKSWLTLVTCKEYDKISNAYRKRVVVRAVLVSVGWE